VSGKLDGRVAIVTGAGQGIGREVALRFAREGAAVGVFEIVKETCERTAADIRAAGGRAVALPFSVADAAQVDRAMSLVERELGPIDVLANIAGIYGHHMPIAQLSLAAWKRVLDVNITGTFLCSKRALRGMIHRRWGRIVNTASGHALSGRATFAPYASSKTAVIGFTKALALEVGRSNVTVNAVMPGVTDTAMPRENDPEGKRLALLAEQNPMGRIGRPEDIANAMAFLASEEASYITGQTIAVNGGIRELP
jgi:NAD(P)-dependent dehydrogenase (short-subunit alcohol dehydrogenase family)